jgi:gliding motility-associated-like protein
MHKAGQIRIAILGVLLSMNIGLFAQSARDTMGFEWRLLQVTDPSSEVKIQFTPLIPAPALFSSWDFGDSNTNSTDSIAIHSYNTISFTAIDVDYNFKLNGNDLTITRPVIPNTAAFFERLDSNTNVTYTRILRSCFLFPTNNIATHGAMRFEWTINGTVLAEPNYQLPNIRYEFTTPGPNTVLLKVWNTADPLKVATFSRVINILPDFATKQKLDVPNVFSPNNDGVADRFIVNNNSGTSRLVLKVFTRTGALVYQNEANFISWDGKNNNGKELPDGIYYYVIEDKDKQYENAKGFVYIYRGK